MAYQTKEIHYFDKPGPENTADAARFARLRAGELGLSTVVVASTSGSTGIAFADALNGSGIRLVVVTHVVGFAKPGVWEFSKDALSGLRAALAAVSRRRRAGACAAASPAGPSPPSGRDG